FANPGAAQRLDVPCHRLRRGRRGVGNVLADLPAVAPAAAMRIADFGGQADALPLLQQYVAVGGKKSAGKLDWAGQLAHQQKRAGGFRFGFCDQYPEQAVDWGNRVGRCKPTAIQNGAGRRNRKIFAVGSPAAGDQPFTAAAGDQGWLCVVRPGNIGCHGDDKGFREHMFPPSKTADSPARPTVLDRREATVNRTGDPMPNLFARAASWLLGEDPEKTAGRDVRLLLEALGYAATAESPTDGGKCTADTLNRVCLLKAASRFARVFELAAPDAPGLVSFGAEFDPALADPLQAGRPIVGVSGVGVSLQEAFQGCIGEGIEYLSQLQTGNDALEFDPGDPCAKLGPQAREFLAAFSGHRLRPDADLSWHRATQLIDGREVWLPADLCLRRPSAQQEVKPPFPLSTGSAAGRSWDAAALHGLLELIER